MELNEQLEKMIKEGYVELVSLIAKSDDVKFLTDFLNVLLQSPKRLSLLKDGF